MRKLFVLIFTLAALIAFSQTSKSDINQRIRDQRNYLEQIDYVAEYPVDGGKYYKSIWRIGKGEMHEIDFRIIVSAESTELMEGFADRLEAATDRHFTGRSYGLTKGSDFWDAAYWTAYFYELLVKDFDKLKVMKIYGTDEKGRYIEIGEKDLKNLNSLGGLFVPGKRKMKKLNADFFNN